MTPLLRGVSPITQDYPNSTPSNASVRLCFSTDIAYSNGSFIATVYDRMPLQLLKNKKAQADALYHFLFFTSPCCKLGLERGMPSITQP